MSTGPAAPAAPAVDATPNATAEQAGSTFKPPEIQIEPLQLSSIQQNTVSPRRVGETTSRRQLRTARVTQQAHLNTLQNAQEIFTIEQEGESLTASSVQVAAETSKLADTNAQLAIELAQLRSELTAFNKKEVSYEDEQCKKLQRQINATQRDINVMELQMTKLDKLANRYHNHSFALSLVIRHLIKENDALRLEYELERADVNPLSLQLASELLFKKLFDKLGSLTLLPEEKDDAVLKAFDVLEFAENDFDYWIPKPEPPPKTDDDDE